MRASLAALIAVSGLVVALAVAVADAQHRYAAAARARVWRGPSLAGGVTHQAGQLTQRRATALDVGMTYAVRQAIRP